MELTHIYFSFIVLEVALKYKYGCSKRNEDVKLRREQGMEKVAISSKIDLNSLLGEIKYMMKHARSESQ